MFGIFFATYVFQFKRKLEKNVKKCFLFEVKSFFRSQDILI